MDSTSRVQQAHKFWLHHKIPSSNQTKLRWPPFWSLMVITAGQTTRQDKSNKYHKISNLNTLKLSYCCTTNVENIIKQDNSKVLSRTNDHNIRKCNCRSKPSSPLNVECLTQCLVFKPSSTASSNSFVCYGNSEDEFETWYNNHIESLRHREYNEWDWVIITYVKLKKSCFWYQLFMRNPRKGLTIPMWFKMLQPLFFGKSFRHLYWSRHFIKQKNWNDFQVLPH